jgi:uncharacterized protein
MTEGKNMDSQIQNFINSKRIAVVGVSRSGKKFGNMAFAELKKRGYQVFQVHPEAKEIGGEPCYPNLVALSDKVDGVLVVVPPQQAIHAVGDAVAAGLRNVWLQQGAESPEVLAMARNQNINLVSGKCILMYAPPVTSFHNVHRFFMRLFGQL